MNNNKCIECGLNAPDGELWCSDNCEDLHTYDKERAPGYTLIALDISIDKHGKGRRRENSLPPSAAFPESTMPFDDLPF